MRCPAPATPPSLSAHIAFNDNATLVASGGHDGNVILWEVATGKAKFPPQPGHYGPVSAIAFSPNGLMLASGGWDSNVLLWDVNELRPMGLPFSGHNAAISSLAFAPDAATLLSVDESVVMIWDVSVDSWKRRANLIAGRPLRDDEHKHVPYGPRTSGPVEAVHWMVQD